MTKCLLVYITVPEKSEAFDLAREMIERRLAAGANITGPAHSFYRWQGKVCEAEEWQIFAQTSRSTYADLQEYVKSRHPHVVPCIIAAEITSGHRPFLDWIDQNSAGGANWTQQ